MMTEFEQQVAEALASVVSADEWDGFPPSWSVYGEAIADRLAPRVAAAIEAVVQAYTDLLDGYDEDVRRTLRDRALTMLRGDQWRSADPSAP